MSDGKHSPLDQFKINYWTDFPEIFGLNLNFSQASFWMLVATACISALMLMGIKSKAQEPKRLQCMVEMLYEFVAKIMRDTVGEEGRKYFPFIFTLFMFILMANLLGMLPGAFTTTSHLAVTLALAMAVFIGVTVIGIARHGTHFFSLFYPKGTPVLIAPLLVVIEFFAYLVRPMSLSIRLAANMLAGHTMLKVFAGFVVSMEVFGILPLSFMVVLTGFEIFVAVLQAYIFTVLSCVYLNDAIHLH